MIIRAIGTTFAGFFVKNMGSFSQKIMKNFKKYYPNKIYKKVSASEFLEMVEKSPEKIKSSRVELPKLGSSKLDGKFVVELKH